FDNCDFANLDKYDALKNFTQLKSLYFNNCKGITPPFLRPLLDITTSLKIKSLKIVCQFPDLNLLLRKI
ncbi:10164_t:CDS:1, partial [Funneliformis geosporum]